MKVVAKDGTDLLAFWKQESTLLRVELISGHVFVSFTGTVFDYTNIELVISRDLDEMSISLFCGKFNLIELSPESANEEIWQKYVRVVQIVTDAGAQCTIHELR
jgi:hypothetical protein